MAKHNPFRDHVADLLSPLDGVSIRPMFGGFGVYVDGLMSGLIAEDTLYLKVDDANRAEFEAAGSAPFKPFADKPMTMPYWEVPAEVMDDAEALCAWTRRAHEAARRAQAAKPKSKPKTGRQKRT